LLKENRGQKGKDRSLRSAGESLAKFRFPSAGARIFHFRIAIFPIFPFAGNSGQKKVAVGSFYSI
jgi:hypothetical protein